MEEQEALRTIPFITEDGEEIDMYVLEETVLQGIHYILVTDELSEDSEEAFVSILKETRQAEDEEYSVYEPVENEDELTSIAKIFSELMEDVDFEM
jgi:hypothetical protein